MDHVDVRKKNWLIPFAREVVGRFDEPAARARVGASRTALADSPERADAIDAIETHEITDELDETESGARFDAWFDEALRARGLLTGAPLARWPRDQDPKHRGTWFLLNTLVHQLELLLELRLFLGLGIDGVSDQFALLVVLAASCGDFEVAEELYELALEDWGPSGDARREQLAKEMGPAVRRLGNLLREQRLQDYNHPLLGLPLHHVLNYASTCQLIAIAHLQFTSGGRVDEELARRERASGHLQRVHLIEALLALAMADGEVSRVERRLVEHVIELAKLSPADQKQVWASVETPITAAQLGALVTDRRTRRFLFEQILLHGMLEGPLEPSEETFVAALGDAFGIRDEERLVYEAEALAYLETHPELVEAFSLTGLVRRFRDHLSTRVESIVRTNLSRLVTEVRETGELGQLLLKRAQGPLTVEEEEKVRQQLLDICKTVPTLAVFAAPGGTLLLPILMRLLPFDLMPSAFTERDETL